MERIEYAKRRQVNFDVKNQSKNVIWIGEGQCCPPKAVIQKATSLSYTSITQCCRIAISATFSDRVLSRYCSTSSFALPAGFPSFACGAHFAGVHGGRYKIEGASHRRTPRIATRRLIYPYSSMSSEVRTTWRRGTHSWTILRGGRRSYRVR